MLYDPTTVFQCRWCLMLFALHNLYFPNAPFCLRKCTSVEWDLYPLVDLSVSLLRSVSPHLRTGFPCSFPLRVVMNLRSWRCFDQLMISDFRSGRDSSRWIIKCIPYVSLFATCILRFKEGISFYYVPEPNCSSFGYSSFGGRINRLSSDPSVTGQNPAFRSFKCIWLLCHRWCFRTCCFLDPVRKL